jgi:hypothetical protein
MLLSALGSSEESNISKEAYGGGYLCQQSPVVWKNIFGVHTVSRDCFTFCATSFIQPLVLLSALLLVTSCCVCAAHLSRTFYCQFNARFVRLGGLEVGDEGSILIRDRNVRTYKAEAQKYSHEFREHPELLELNCRAANTHRCQSSTVY